MPYCGPCFCHKSPCKQNCKCGKKKLFIAFIDFRKAYDTVNRKLLLLKLLRLGTRLLYRNIKASLNSVSYLVKVKGCVLSPILSSLGLKQGGVLSHLLFNVFIDDLGKIFDESCDPIKELEKPISHLLIQYKSHKSEHGTGNDLPKSVVNAKDVNSFKNQLD